jgi:hypothetical protein
MRQRCVAGNNSSARNALDPEFFQQQSKGCDSSS